MAATGLAPVLGPAEVRDVVLKRYDEAINYYWKTKDGNKRSYMTTRYLLIVLGAVVTLISSLGAASFVTGWLATFFAILTPLLAASMAIVGGVSQTFQWGAAWSDAVITATRLKKERNRVEVMPLDKLDAEKELAFLDDMVIAETQGFFQRLFGTGGPPKDDEPKPKP